LVTGSLHLIGSVLNQIEPDLWSRMPTEQEKAEREKIIKIYLSEDKRGNVIDNGEGEKLVLNSC